MSNRRRQPSIENIQRVVTVGPQMEIENLKKGADNPGRDAIFQKSQRFLHFFE
jgi:hypothetical protein